MIDHSDVVGMQLYLTAEERHDGLSVVVRDVVLVETVEQCDFVLRRNLNIA